MKMATGSDIPASCFVRSPLYQTRKCWYSSCNHQVPLNGHLCAGFIHLSLWFLYNVAMSPKYHFVTQKLFVLPSFENVSAIERVSAGLNGCVCWGQFSMEPLFCSTLLDNSIIDNSREKKLAEFLDVRVSLASKDVGWSVAAVTQSQGQNSMRRTNDFGWLVTNQPK